MGRIPKPTAVKKMEGRKYGLNENEPQPLPMTLESLSPPEFLSDEAKEIWASAAKRLIDLGVLTEMDAPAFSIMCMTYGEMMIAYKSLQEGERISDEHGGKHRSPMAVSWDREFDKLLKMLKEFGMTPASRAKIITNLPPEGKGGKFEDLLD